MTDLRDRWLDLIQAVDADVQIGLAVVEDLFSRYGEPHRFCHTLVHIRSVLEVIDMLEHRAADPVPVRLAAWFHDAVYDSRAANNEEQSAALATACLTRLGISESTIAETRFLVLATKTHSAPQENGNAQVLLDADLAILGAAEDDYEVYAKAIRKEYSWVAEDDYRTGRARVLKSFMQRESIYQTPEMMARSEKSARSNLLREIELLGR